MEAYSLDLRERILRICDESGLTRQETAEDFGVSRSFLQKLLRRMNEGGSIAPKPHRGGRTPTWHGAEAQVRELVRLKPDSTLTELCQALVAGGGPAVRLWTMCRVLQTLGLALKKSRCTPVNRIVPTFRPCAKPSGGGWRGSIPNGWFSWTKAVRIPP
jgi:transposase